jgi:hypothetical protein
VAGGATKTSPTDELRPGTPDKEETRVMKREESAR